MQEKNNKTKIVVVGGGTGSFTVLSGLKTLPNVLLTAIVASTDSGGSTGRLRDEFGKLPVGDLRQCLVALAENTEEQELLRELFAYRFDKGNDGLKGHNFGNLFMTAVRDILDGDELKAIRVVEKLLNIRGKVYPVTLEECHLVAEYENGKTLEGEHEIDEPAFPHDGKLRITNLHTSPKVDTHPNVVKAIKKADYIIFGPGDLYSSILANVVINDMPVHIANSKAKKIYFGNLVTKFGQTYNFKLSDHVNEMERYCKCKLDFIVVNNAKLPKDILEKYELENAFPVETDINDKRVIKTDLLMGEEVQSVGGDIVRRSLIRHDSGKIAETIQLIIDSEK